MSTSQHSAEVVIKGRTDGVAGKLKEVADGTEKVKRAADAAGASQEAWGDKLDRVDKKMKGFADGINRVTGLLGAGGLVSMAQSAAAAIGEMAERAGQITIANQALAISIGAARQATMGLVGDYDLTVAANKAVTLGVVKTDAEFAKLAATAAKLGQAMGQSAGQSVDDLTTALGRQSVMILDNLGISLKLEQAYEEYGARIGKTALQLDDAEKKQAFLTIALERAEAAANKANISLDTQAAKIQQLSTRWTNLKDSISTGVTNAMVGLVEFTDDAVESTTRLSKGMEDVPTKTYEDSLLRITDKLNGANSATLTWLSSVTLTGAEIGRQASAQNEEKIIGMRREEYLQQRAANDEMRKSIALEEERRIKAGKALELDAKKQKKGKKRADFLDPGDVAIARGYDGVADTEVIARAPGMQAQEEAMARELQMRQDRIQLIEHEQELVSMNVEAGLMSAEAEEAVQQRKYLAEKDLLDFQIQAATTRAEIIDLETARRNKALAEQQRQMSKSQAVEIKNLQNKQAAYQQYGGAIGGAIQSITAAAMAGADGQDHAAARIIAATGKQIRNQLIMEAILQSVLAIASAASYDFGGAAAHGVAAGVATGGAVLVGAIAGTAGAFVPSSPSGGAGGGGDSSTFVGRGGGSSSKGGSSSSKGGGDDDGVPTSYYDGGLYSKRPDRSPQGAANTKGDTYNITATVLGATEEQVGLGLRRVLDKANRSLGGVK